MSKPSRRPGREHRHQRGPTRAQLQRELIDALTASGAEPEVVEYARLLFAAGMPERECYRAAFYAEANGMAALTAPGDQCVLFDEPSCGNWNCLAPDHQVVVFS